MEKSSFFNAELVGEEYDRTYLAEDYAQYFASFIGNGVFPNPSNNLQVLADGTSMNVSLSMGKAWINGYFYANTTDLVLSIAPADGILNRIDRVVLRLDFLNREIKAYVKKGAFASTPTAPSLQRDADMYEIALADIYIKAGVIFITQSNITDLRLSKELCGIVHGTVDQVDTTAIFNQFQSWYSTTKANYDNDMANWTNEKKQEFDTWYTTNTAAFMEQFTDWYNSNTTQWGNDFETWFSTIKGQLEGDIAAKLSVDVVDLKEGKVDKVTGKGLSTNDYSNAEKQEVAKIPGIESQLGEMEKKEYCIELVKFGIYNDGTHAQETINGINSAITYAKSKGYSNIFLPVGTYLVKCDDTDSNRIKIPSNTKLRLDVNSIVQVETNSNPVYCVFQIKQSDNVIIEGGQIIGDKSTHTYTSGDYQYLISIWGSKNVVIRNMKLSQSPCIGIRIQEINGTETIYSQNVRIYDNEIFNIGSCGIANEGVNGLWIKNNSIHDVYGYSIEQGIDIEGKMISEAYVLNNNFYNNGKGDILVYIPKISPFVNADNIFISNNRCTKKIWIECDNNTTPIKVFGNTVNNPSTTGDIPTVDFALYAKGKNIHLKDNVAYGHVRIYKITDSVIEGLYVKGKTLTFSECVNSSIKNIEFHSTLYVYKNFSINKMTNSTFRDLKLDSCYSVIEGDNVGLILNNVDSFNFTDIAFEIYGSGLETGTNYTFNNLILRNRPADSTAKLFKIGSAYVTVAINNILIKDIKSTSNDFELVNYSTLIINGGELSNFNKLDNGNAGSIARKMVLKNLYLKTSKATTPILVAQGDTKLIVTNCLFECSSSVVAIQTSTATANSIITQNTFLTCTISTKVGDTATNNTVI